jgi:biotin carboxyl carrier protein
VTRIERRRLRITDLDADDGSYHDIDPESEADPPRMTAPDGTAGRRDGGRATEPHSLVTRLPAATGSGERGIDRLEVVVDGWRYRFQVEDAQRARLRDRARRAAAEHGPATPQTIRAQIPGRVVSVAVAPGDRVVLGQPLLAIEAMKMENEVRAPRAGIVERIGVAAGDRVELGEELARIV